MKTQEAKTFPNLLKRAAMSYLDNHLLYARLRTRRFYVAHDYSVKPFDGPLDTNLILADIAAECSEGATGK